MKAFLANVLQNLTSKFKPQKYNILFKRSYLFTNFFHFENKRICPKVILIVDVKMNVALHPSSFIRNILVIVIVTTTLPPTMFKQNEKNIHCMKHGTYYLEGMREYEA